MWVTFIMWSQVGISPISIVHQHCSIIFQFTQNIFSRPEPPFVCDPSEPGHGQASKIVTPDLQNDTIPAAVKS